jgi:5-methyltetrahydrofolate--homocysteine methyltransferase
MGRDFLHELATRSLVSDGAMGTMLFAKGLAQGECPEEWVESHPDDVKSIHHAYIDAGCDIVLTNTFGGSPIKLHQYGYDQKAADWNRQAAELARKAAGEDRFVAGSIGPTGEFFQPLGTMKEEDAYQGFTIQALALERGGVDAIFIETMTILEEIVLAVKAVKDHTNLPVVATMTFDERKGKYRTLMGVSPEKAVEALQEAGADVVGTNCGAGPEVTVGVLRAMRAVTDGYLAGKPNAGLPKVIEGENVYPMTPQEMVVQMRPMLELKVNIVGGCCGTTPEFLRRIAQMVKNGN